MLLEAMLFCRPVRVLNASKRPAHLHKHAPERLVSILLY